MKLLSYIFVAFLTFVISSCNFAAYTGTGKVSTVDPNIEQALESSQAPSFNFIKTEILAKNNTCTECHNWANNYETVLYYVLPGNSADSLLIKNLQNMGGTMPKNKGALNEKTIELLQQWIDSGANEQAQTKLPPGSIAPPVYPDNPTFADVAKYVFTTNCNSCHNSDPKAKAHHFPFQNYATILTLKDKDSGMPVVTPGDINNSAMWNDISTADMPPQKAINAGTATPLTQEQIDLVKRWIEQGAKQ